MANRAALRRRLIVALSLLAASGLAVAGEIILVPSKGEASSSESEASRQRETAREYRKNQTAAPAAVIVVPDEEGGILAPRRAPNGAAENAARARAARQGESAPVILPVPAEPQESPGVTETPAAQSARRNRARAIEYRKGEQHSAVVVKGGDGLPVIDCSNVDNIAGRIGDDTRSGSVITLIQDRNQVKVRCR